MRNLTWAFADHKVVHGPEPLALGVVDGRTLDFVGGDEFVRLVRRDRAAGRGCPTRARAHAGADARCVGHGGLLFRQVNAAEGRMLQTRPGRPRRRALGFLMEPPRKDASSGYEARSI